MGITTVISIEEFLNTSYRPDCDFIDGKVLDRSVGKLRHSYALAYWFDFQIDVLKLQSLR